MRPARVRTKVTIRDVAREAGVSVATVSRVFNDSGPVNAETRQRIHDIARRLRYSPDSAARSLITRRTSTLGVLLPDLYGEFFSEVIRGIHQLTQRGGYHVLVSSSHADKGEVEAALRAMRGRVDGLVLMSPDIDAPALVANIPDALPIVLLNCALDGDEYDSIMIDNFGGAFEMTQHLLGLGHRRIAFVRGGERNHDAAERLRGYRAALAAAGVKLEPELELPGDFTESAGFEAARHLVADGSGPTAIFAGNDSMAFGAMSALRDAGVRVPDEVSVAGFDDIPIAAYMSPPLTTTRVAIAQLGELAIRTLLRAIDEGSEHEPRRQVLPTELVVRRSTAASEEA